MATKLKQALGKAPNCLTAEELSAYLQRELSPARSGRCRDHLKGCPACKAELELLRAFEDPRLSPSEEEDVDWISRKLRMASPAAASPPEQAPPLQEVELTSSTTSSTPSLWAALLGWRGLSLAGLAAAALLMAAGLGLWQAQPSIPSLPTSGGPDVLRSATLEIVEPRGRIEAVPQRLAWKGAAGAAHFEVSIYRVDRSPLWKARATGESLGLPSEIRQMLTPGTRFLWQVTAWAANGQRLQASQLESFQVMAEENR